METPRYVWNIELEKDEGRNSDLDKYQLFPKPPIDCRRLNYPFPSIPYARLKSSIQRRQSGRVNTISKYFDPPSHQPISKTPTHHAIKASTFHNPKKKPMEYSPVLYT